MWRALDNPALGFMNEFSDSIADLQRRNLQLVPELRQSKTLIAVSDYGGAHRALGFEAYSLLITCGDSWNAWEEARLRVRQDFDLEKRRFAFSKMGDNRKRRALSAFLSTADLLHGLSVTVLIDKRIVSLFSAGAQHDPSIAARLSPGGHYTRGTFERLMRAVHLVSFFVAGLSGPGQNLIWLTDEDEIAANPARLTGLTAIFANVASHYLHHTLGHLRCGTTASDNGSLQIEDMAAIPDLVGGALTELITAYHREGCMPSGTLIAPAPPNLISKAREVIRWLSVEPISLKRLVYVIQPEPQSHALTLTRLLLHSVPFPVTRNG